MSGLHVKRVVLAASVACGLLWPASSFAAQRHSQRHPAAKESGATPAPAPLTLQELPASPPRVEYHNGELIIVAENSTLGDILRAVQAETGATLDVPRIATERVVSHLGPGPARQILAELLNGTRFNYVMLGSASDPNALAQVILTLKPPPSSETVASAPPPPTAAPPPPEQMSTDAADDDADSDDSPDSANAPEQAAPAPAAAQQPEEPTVKTPQQLLEELRRQLEQQQQQNAPQGQSMPVRPR